MTSNRSWLPAALIVLSAFLLYANTIPLGYTLDDPIYTTKNAYVQQGFSAFTDVWTKGSLIGFNGRADNQYRPLSLFSFMVEAQIFGLNPHVGHLINILLFALSGVLIYVLLTRGLPKLNRTFPLIMALLFVFHPAHVEAVANVKSRDEILCLLFGIVSLLQVHRYVSTGRAADYWSSVVAFAAAALCKENGVTFLLVVPLVLYFFTAAPIPRIAKMTGPYGAVLLLLLIVRNTVLGSVAPGTQPVINNSLMAATSTSDMLATNFVLLGKYVYLLLIPYPLSWDYSYNQIPIVSFANVWAIAGLLLYVALAAYAVVRTKSKDVFAFAIFFYLITLSVSSNLVVKIASTFAERLIYTPSLGFCIAVPLLLAKCLTIDPEAGTLRRREWLYGTVGTVLLVCAVIVVTRNEAWADNVTLFRAGVITSPNSARAQAALAEELQTEADRTPDAATRTALYRQALDHFEKALAIYADDADVLFNEATIYHQTGEPEKALKRYEQTLRISPQYVPALTGLGLVYADRKDYDQAIALFERALDVSPRHADALVNLGAAYQNKGDFSKAIDAYTRSLAVEPNNAIVMMNLANLYNANCGTHFNAGEWSQALSNCTEALKYAPDSANVMTNIGNVYLNMNDVAKATEYYRKALSHDPANEEARERLAHIEATRLH